jgi:hypothetical protein
MYVAACASDDTWEYERIIDSMEDLDHMSHNPPGETDGIDPVRIESVDRGVPRY